MLEGVVRVEVNRFEQALRIHPFECFLEIILEARVALASPLADSRDGLHGPAAEFRRQVIPALGQCDIAGRLAVGIGPEHIRHALEPFEDLDASGRTPAAGLLGERCLDQRGDQGLSVPGEPFHHVVRDVVPADGKTLPAWISVARASVLCVLSSSLVTRLNAFKGRYTASMLSASEVKKRCREASSCSACAARRGSSDRCRCRPRG